jgi:hypothetical protein
MYMPLYYRCSIIITRLKLYPVQFLPMPFARVHEKASLAPCAQMRSIDEYTSSRSTREQDY